MQSVLIIDAGLMHYSDAHALQLRLLDDVAAARSAGAIILLEHPRVLTFGRNSDKKFLKLSQGQLDADGIEVVTCERGGEITAHMPGQLVVYPILPLSTLRLGVRRYVAALESAVIAMLGEYEVVARVDDAYPGVWCGQNKICAIGVRIKQRVSMHGLALNICNDLTLFDKIVPCGIAGRGVTSLSRQLGRTVDVAEIKARFLAHLLKALALTDVATQIRVIESLPKTASGNTIPV